MRMKKLTLACLAASLGVAGCGGGGSDPSGSTVSQRGVIGTAYSVACVDHNDNLRCDDGDPSVTVTTTGATGLTPASDEYVLLEGRTRDQQRTTLLLSERGQSNVDGLSTLKALLGEHYDSTLDSIVASQNDALETLFATALQAQPLALPALYAASHAVRDQQTATPTLSAAAITIANAEAVTSWDATAGNDTRQLTAYGSLVLSNTETNRLYLFDASAEGISASEIDLLPVLDNAVAKVQEATSRLQKTLIEPALKALASVLDVVIDTASAASSISGQPSGEPPQVFEPGTGITALQMVANGSEAYVLMNTADDFYTEDQCNSVGSEGLYKVALDAEGGVRMLAQSPACIHSGFSLLAADLAGAHVIAWDTQSQRLWLMDGELHRQKAIATGVASAQALAISPGGQFAAIAAYGQLAIVDLVQGRTVANLAGNWTNASQVSFSSGLNRVLVSSGKDLHTVTLDNAMQLIDSRSVSLDDDILTLASAQDGDSHVVSTASDVFWYASQSGQRLASQSLPAKLDIKRIALADNQLLVLGQQRADDRYALFRLPLSLPVWPQ